MYFSLMGLSPKAKLSLRYYHSNTFTMPMWSTPAIAAHYKANSI